MSTANLRKCDHDSNHVQTANYKDGLVKVWSGAEGVDYCPVPSKIVYYLYWTPPIAYILSAWSSMSK